MQVRCGRERVGVGVILVKDEVAAVDETCAVQFRAAVVGAPMREVEIGL